MAFPDLRALRATLDTHWARHGQTSAGQCIRVTALLHHLTGGAVQGGWPTPHAPGGFITARGAHFHYWLELGGFIIDLTADQFGDAPVIYTPTPDARYRPCATPADIHLDFRDVRAITLPALLRACTSGDR
ncbi:hypothetical protein [Deinococcus soli (ex Cha et al. 2016)]|uniref:Uncharacterized protein n=2 Tax=Deinococcus soli (ex Cha et al. 2016) TaxID=1309411 RepID=A0AAE4BLM0_9DEIO|nr:hypothetical protein [Deinococcus soli (ex Cha et al. 2016)]MDR6218150.1 hypothetical protein [Deinococcus soli (ex Cha et al. 2016)]MDR6328890.1 hypothetical protein [Deinococcus soli (ex Cha et al. 2016)]MDR6751622.1 hypothetical protein [Deinococcus soli (ex Cha et al. 2016)]